MKNITFKELKIQNFLSFGKETIIPFTKGMNIITGVNLDKDSDGNGVGKSAIVDSFFFSLFGETLKDLKKDEIINHLAKKNCKVTLTFDINKNGTNTSYRIERGLAPSFCRLYIDNNEDKTLSTIPVTNNYILNLINSTSTVFRNIIAMSINSANPFMALKKNEKRSFLEGILRLELFSIMNKTARDSHDVIFKEYELIIQSYEENNRNIQIYDERKNNFEKNRIEKLNDYNQRIQQCHSEIDSLGKTIVPLDLEQYQQNLLKFETLGKELVQKENQYQESIKKIATLDGKQEFLTSQLNNILEQSKKLKDEYQKLLKFEHLPKNSNECKEQIKKDTQTIEEYQTKISDFNNDIVHLTEDIDKVKKFGVICSKCKRPFPESDVEKNNKFIEDAQNSIKDKRIQRDKLIEEIKTLKTVIATLELISQIFELTEQKKQFTKENENINTSLIVEKQTLEKINGEKHICSIAISGLQKDKENTQVNLERNKTAQSLIQNYKNTIEQYNKDTQKLSTEENEFANILTVSENKKTEMAKKIEEFKEKIVIYETIKFVVSDEGVRSYIIKKLLTTLNSRIDYYLVKLDANCKLIFNEFFEDTIVNDKNIECSYYNFSGGERKRIDLACLFAFMDLRRIQGDVAFNLTFLDELLDSAVSVDCTKKIFEILKERIDKYNESTYIITHRKENLNNDMINNVIYLEKSGGITRLSKSIGTQHEQ